MKTKYKLMILVPLMALIGCKEYEYKVIIDAKGQIGDNDYFTVLHDLETDNTKLYYWNHEPNWFEGFSVGDTATVVYVKGWHNKRFDYEQNHIINDRDAKLDVDVRTVAKRLPDNPLVKEMNRDGRVRVY